MRWKATGVGLRALSPGYARSVDARSDERATEPPGTEPPDQDPGEGEPEPDPGDSPGPMGNPASDEEALSHRQQEDG